MSEDDATEGYRDGRDPDSPRPSDNRSALYRHCWEVGRREIKGCHWTAEEARRRARWAEATDCQLRRPDYPDA